MSSASTPRRRLLATPPRLESARTSPATKTSRRGREADAAVAPSSSAWWRAAGLVLAGALAGGAAAAAALGAASPGLARRLLDQVRPGTASQAVAGQPTYLLIDTFESGLNNQRISVLKAAELASRHGYAMVLPAFKDVHGPQHGKKPGSTVILPFSHFYEVGPWAAHAAAHNFSVVSDLPPTHVQACTKQLSFAASFAYALTAEFYAGWAAQHGVLCLNSRAVWFGMEGGDAPDIGWDRNPVHAAGLVPSKLYVREVDRMMETARALYGTSSFIAVHVRTEADWARVCSLGEDRREITHWLAGSDRACYVTPGEVAAFLGAAGVEKGALAFVMSADPVSSMPALCGPGGALTCFTPDDVWTDVDPGLAALVPRTQLVRAYVSYLLAERASALFGNTHSTFSQQLVQTFKEGGKPAVFYNPKCPLTEPCP